MSLRSPIFRNASGDDELRRIERAVAEDPTDFASARRLGDLWRRHGREGWPQILTDMMYQAVEALRAANSAGGIEGSWRAPAAAWARLVMVMGFSPDPRLQSALDQLNRTIGATRPRSTKVTLNNISDLLLHYWPDLMAHVLDERPAGEFDIVATWIQPVTSGLARSCTLFRRGDVTVNTHHRFVMPRGTRRLPALASAIVEGSAWTSDAVIVDMSWVDGHSADRLEPQWIPGPLFLNRSKLVDEAWYARASEREHGITTQTGWNFVEGSPVYLTLSEAIFFLVERDLMEDHPELLSVTPDVVPTAVDVTSEVERILSAANGKRSSMTIDVDDVRSAVKAALGESEPVVVAAIGGSRRLTPPLSNLGAAGSILVPDQRRQAHTYFREEPAQGGFSSRIRYLWSTMPRRSLTRSHATFLMVSAADGNVTIGAIPATGRAFGYYDPTVWINLWQREFQGAATLENMRAWMHRKADDRIMIPREVAREWVSGLEGP